MNDDFDHRPEEMGQVMNRDPDRKKTKKNRWIAAAAADALLCVLAAFAWRLVFWVFHNWANLQADELLYTMGANLQGTNSQMIVSAAKYTVPFMLLALFAVAGISFLLRNKEKARRVFLWSACVLAVVAIAGAFFYFADKIGFWKYLKNQNTSSTFIEEHYVDPETASLTFPDKKRNLIYIYVESMETSFADPSVGGGKPENIIPELTEVGLENEMFSGGDGMLNGGYAMYGATYTMGGLFAQTSGLPLTIPPDTLYMREGFFPSLVTIGDILEEEGYHNIFCIGTDAAFSNRDVYFSDHGNYDIWDFEYSIRNGEIPEDYKRDWWGYDDAILYENAKAHLTELAAAGEPFNFTMLTVDTHAEDGYMCSLCRDDFGDDVYSNSFACASRQAADFLDWIKEQDFYENTTVVISGDHCTMDSDYGDDIVEGYERKVFTAFINPACEREGSEKREYCTMDYFPTTLAAMGVKIDGERLGLGTNLFSDTPTLVETYGKSELNKELARKSEFIQNALGEEKQQEYSLDFDPETNELIVTMGEVDYPGRYVCVWTDLTHKESGRYERFEMEKTDSGYAVRAPFKDLGMKDGEYDIAIVLGLPDKLTHWYCGGSFNANDLGFTSPIRLTPKNGGKDLDIALSKDGLEKYSEINFAVWNEENDQDDLVWYKARKHFDGKWHAKIPLDEHRQNGKIIIHIYGNTPEESNILIMDSDYDL